MIGQLPRRSMQPKPTRSLLHTSGRTRVTSTRTDVTHRGYPGRWRSPRRRWDTEFKPERPLCLRARMAAHGCAAGRTTGGHGPRSWIRDLLL